MLIIKIVRDREIIRGFLFVIEPLALGDSTLAAEQYRSLCCRRSKFTGFLRHVVTDVSNDRHVFNLYCWALNILRK